MSAAHRTLTLSSRQGCFSKPVRLRHRNRLVKVIAPPNGFTLVETLLAVSLLGVFSLLAFRLIGSNMHITEATLAADSNTARFDRAVSMLRADVAGSTSIDMPEPGTLRIKGSDGQPIEWKITGNTLSRTLGTHLRVSDVGQPLNLKLDGAVVLLSTSDLNQIAMAPPPKGRER